MKYTYRIIAVLLLASTGLISAQERKDTAQKWNTLSTKNRLEKTTITGDLQVVQGAIALKKEGITYFITGLRNLIGFVEGLKEGATVTLEGYALPTIRHKTSVLFRASKLIIGTKDYVLSSSWLGNGQMMLLWNDIPEPRLRSEQYFNYRDNRPRYGQNNQSRRHQKHRHRPVPRWF
ncbi:MAG: hypothetical protein LBO67_04960 [Spirochaetaceae bacterium]|nr:hypothetical protein [Spirochaetaceae bacterium]